MTCIRSVVRLRPLSAKEQSTARHETQGVCEAWSSKNKRASAPPPLRHADLWCELADRKSWNDTDMATQGRCVGYQELCMSCTGTFEEDNPPTIPGLDAGVFFSGEYSNSPFYTTTSAERNIDYLPLGSYLQLPAHDLEPLDI